MIAGFNLYLKCNLHPTSLSRPLRGHPPQRGGPSPLGKVAERQRGRKRQSLHSSLYFPAKICYYKSLKGGEPVKTKKLTTLSLLCAIALTIFMLEAQIPPLVPIPGIKLGLANIVTVFAVFAIGPKEAAAVLFARIFLGAVFAGNFSTIFYSAAGGTLAILVTIGLKFILTKKQLWIAGTLGAIAHSIGQMAMAVALTGTPSLILYLPVMIAVSILTGSFTGLCAQLLVNRGNLWKITSA